MAEQINQTERERIIAERQAEIAELTKQRSQLFRDAIVFIRYPGKTKKVKEARRNKAFAYGVQAMMLSYRILAIASQPIPKFNLGAERLQAIMGDAGPEIIEIKDGQFYALPNMPSNWHKTKLFPDLSQVGKMVNDPKHISEIVKQLKRGLNRHR